MPINRRTARKNRDTPPIGLTAASPVTITRRDGTTVTEPPQVPGQSARAFDKPEPAGGSSHLEWDPRWSWKPRASDYESVSGRPLCVPAWRCSSSGQVPGPAGAVLPYGRNPWWNDHGNDRSLLTERPGPSRPFDRSRTVKGLALPCL